MVFQNQTVVNVLNKFTIPSTKVEGKESCYVMVMQERDCAKLYVPKSIYDKLVVGKKQTLITEYNDDIKDEKYAYMRFRILDVVDVK